MKFKKFQRYFRFNIFPCDEEKQKKFWETWADIKTIHGRIISKQLGISDDTIVVFTGLARWSIIGRKNEFRNVEVRGQLLKSLTLFIQKMDEVFLYGLPENPREPFVLR